MTQLSLLTEWINSYIHAWNSNDAADIGRLFTEDAEYYTAPYRVPWRGRDQIIESWLDNRDEPGETSFEWHPLVITDDVSIIQGTTRYPVETYSNLWVIRLDENGRCREFTEWWMEQPTSAASTE